MLELIEGGERRRVYGWLDREMHSRFVQVEGANGAVPSTSIYEIRRGRQHPWRCLARRLIEMREADTPITQAKEIVRALDLFVDRIYGSGDAA